MESVNFSYFVYSVFPLLGDVFGRLAAISSVSTSEALSFLRALIFGSDVAVSISYTNLYNGSFGSMFSGGDIFLNSLPVLSQLNSLLRSAFALLQRLVVDNFVGAMPFWLGLFTLVVSFFFFYKFMRFCLSLFR